MTPHERPVTPADWSRISSDGMWVCPPHLDLVNREVVSMARAHHRAIKGLQTDGERLMVLMPPQHGKSVFMSAGVPGWWLGTFPDDQAILGAYEADFAARWGRRSRDAFEAHAPSTFGLHLDPDVAAASHWGVKGRRGSMTTAGAGGAITGNAASMFLIDDPIKGPEEAKSEAHRNSMWDWFVSVAMTRLRRGSCMSMIYTPWHEDDLGQRIIRASVRGDIPPWKVLRIPAIAETQDERDEWAESLGLALGQPDPIGRTPGEALWPDLQPLEKLLFQKKADPYWFEAMYQGRPRPKGGDFFKREWFEKNTVSDIPPGCSLCRYWDKAASAGKGDWTVGVLVARAPDGRFYIVDVVRGRWSSYERDQVIRDTAERDRDRYGLRVAIRSEQEPGSSGKDAALAFVMMLAGYDVKTAPNTGDKETRCRPLASQAEAGNVCMVRGAWNKAWLDEMEGFPRAKFDDQPDATAGGFNTLASHQRLEVVRNPTAGWSGRVERDPASPQTRPRLGLISGDVA